MRKGDYDCHEFRYFFKSLLFLTIHICFSLATKHQLIALFFHRSQYIILCACMLDMGFWWVKRVLVMRGNGNNAITWCIFSGPSYGRYVDGYVVR